MDFTFDIEFENTIQGPRGYTPYIGENGNWWINGEDTGHPSQGITPHIGENGNWYIGEEDTGILSEGHTPYIGENGDWWINGEDTGKPAQGEDYILTEADKEEIANKVLEISPSWNYAEQRAEELWASCENKATEVELKFTTHDYQYYSVTIKNGEKVDLAQTYPDYFTTGYASLTDGFLELICLRDNVYSHEDWPPCFTPNGSLKVDFTGGDLYCRFSGGNGCHILITSSDGSRLCLDCDNIGILTHEASIVLYGPTGFKGNTMSGGTGIATYGGGDIVLGCSGGVSIDAEDTMPIFSEGGVVICGDGDFSLTRRKSSAILIPFAVNSSTLDGPVISTSGGSIRIIEGANLTINSVRGPAIRCLCDNLQGKTAIEIATTGVVKISSSKFIMDDWDDGNVIYARTGSVKISSKVLMNITVGKYTTACGAAIAVLNKGSETTVLPDGTTGDAYDHTAGLYLTDNAEVVINMVTPADSTDTNIRMVGVWINYGVLSVADSAKFTVRYEHNRPFTTNFGAVVVKCGAFYISDNARVYFHGINNSTADSSGMSAIHIQKGDDDTVAANTRQFFGDNAGLHITGGQLEVNAPSNALLYADYAELRGGTHFSGGIVSVKDVGGLGQYLFSQDLDQVTEKRYNIVVKGPYSYCGPVTLDGGTKIEKGDSDYNNMARRSGDVAEFLYRGTGSRYYDYDGIKSNADFFGDLSTAHNDFAIALNLINEQLMSLPY